MIILNETSGVPACAVCSSGYQHHHAGRVRKAPFTTVDLTKVTEFLSKNVIKIQINIRIVQIFGRRQMITILGPFLSCKDARPVPDSHSLSDDLPFAGFVNTSGQTLIVGSYKGISEKPRRWANRLLFTSLKPSLRRYFIRKIAVIWVFPSPKTCICHKYEMKYAICSIISCRLKPV
jgi:hypothetical protein